MKFNLQMKKIPDFKLSIKELKSKYGDILMRVTGHFSQSIKAFLLTVLTITQNIQQIKSNKQYKQINNPHFSD